MKRDIYFLGCGVLFFASMFFMAPQGAEAETVILKSGKRIEGKVVKQTDTSITVEVQGMPLTFFWDEVVEPVPPSAVPSTGNQEKDAVIAVVKSFFQHRFDVKSPTWLSDVSKSFAGTAPDGRQMDYEGLKATFIDQAAQGLAWNPENLDVPYCAVTGDAAEVLVTFLGGGDKEKQKVPPQGGGPGREVQKRRVVLKKELGAWKITGIASAKEK